MSDTNRLSRAFAAQALLAAFAVAPMARGVTITSCDETTIKKAVATGNAVFGVNCNITLTSTIDIPVSLTNPVVRIRGNGFAVTLDGGHSVGVINVPGSAVLLLENVTIANGRTASSTGGGISNAGGLDVIGCSFVNNTNAIQNTGSLSITSSTFTGNVATAGGAIIHTGPSKAYITYSSFGASSAPSSGNGGGQTGGAVYVSGTSAEIDNSQFYFNLATQGGAIYAFTSLLTLTGDYFQGNTASPGGSGGAIANIGSNITITNPSTGSRDSADPSSGGFQSNSAPSSATAPGLGGAIYNQGVETLSCGTFCILVFHAPSLTLNTVGFHHNAATTGGAIYSAGDTGFLGCCNGVTKVTNSDFEENGVFNIDSRLLYGGAIDNEGTAQLSITGSTIEANAAGHGSAIRNAQGPLNITNSTIIEGVCPPIHTLENDSATAVIEYSTLFFDCTGYGIGGSGVVKLEGTILQGGPAYSFQGQNPGSCENSAKIIDGGYNLETDNSCGLTAANNSLINSNPNLNIFSFGFNGGPTPTFPLPTGSPAIDKIPLGTLGCGVLNTPGAFDQRGVSRPQGFLCDIGAIEHLFSNLPTSSTTCNGIYNKTFTGDITVLPGQSCVFLAGGITGNLQVKGGRFEVRYATVSGNVEIDGGSTFSIGPSATIGGNVEIHNLPPSTTTNQVCGANVHGGLAFHNNASSVLIGSQDSSSCPGNTIGGSVEVHNNSASTSIDGNSITGNVEDHNNTGPTQIFNNLIKGSLDCHQNSSITGGLDIAKQKQGQCAAF